MVRYFTRCEESIEEFKKIGINEYPLDQVDIWYDTFLKICKSTKESEVKRELISIKRLVLPDDYIGGNITKESPHEVLVWNVLERRHDALGNWKTHTHSSLGIFCIPVPKWTMKLGSEDEGYEKVRVVEGIDRYDTGYSKFYTPENVDEICKMAVWNTSYIIQKYVGGQRITVDNLKSFREAPAAELLRWGHAASSVERNIMNDEVAGFYEPKHIAQMCKEGKVKIEITVYDRVKEEIIHFENGEHVLRLEDKILSQSSCEIRSWNDIFEIDNIEKAIYLDPKERASLV